MRVCYTGRCLVAFFGRSALVWRCGEALCVPLKCCAVALGDLVPDQVLRVVQLTLWFLWLCWMLCMLYFAFFSKTNKKIFFFLFQIPRAKLSDSTVPTELGLQKELWTPLVGWGQLASRNAQEALSVSMQVKKALCFAPPPFLSSTW